MTTRMYLTMCIAVMNAAAAPWNMTREMDDAKICIQNSGKIQTAVVK